MTPLPLLLVVVVASVPGAHCSSFDLPDISSSSSSNSYIYDTDAEGLGQSEYHEDEESVDDLDEGEDEEDMGGYLLVAPPRKKRDPSFYPATSNARERLLLNLHGQKQEESRRLVKRSREKTMKQEESRRLV